MMQKIKLGTSACLMGDEVRFNGGHCRNHFLNNTFFKYADFVSVCPETAIGMGVPREAVRLEKMPDERIEMRDPKSGKTYGKDMMSFSKSWAGKMAELDLDGFVFKKNSPSCGVFRVKIYQNGQPSERRGRGMFAAEIMERYPYLPVEEEGRLSDPVLRENFIERVFAYRRVKSLFEGKWSRGDVVEFHSREKLLLMAHCPQTYRNLGRLVGEISSMERDDFKDQYIEGFMAGMEKKPSKGRHVNALSHMAGYLKNMLSGEAKKELKDAIEGYRAGYVPLSVPFTLLSHLLRRFDETYLLSQTYLMPFPKELALRNHI